MRRVHLEPGSERVKLFKTMLAACAVGLAAMTFGASAQDKGTVGIAMPTKSSLRVTDWRVTDGRTR